MREKWRRRHRQHLLDSGLIGNFGQTNYAPPKAASWGLSNVLRSRAAKDNIRVWTLAPGALTA